MSDIYPDQSEEVVEAAFFDAVADGALDDVVVDDGDEENE